MSKGSASDGVYVGEVVALGIVKGTASDDGDATITAGAIAEKFCALYQARTDVVAQVR